MSALLSRLLDRISAYLAHRKGLVPLLGIILILANFILNLVSVSWLAQSDFLLHLGIILAILGFMLAWAL